MKVFGSVVLLFAAFFSSTKGDKSMYKMESYDNGNYKVMWKYDMITDMFYFNVTVNATGWVGFGVSKTKGGMKDYDVMVGGVDKSGKGYAKDYLTTERAMPMPPDAEQNYNLTNSWEMNGYTSLMFSRKRDTGDTQGDVVIEPGMMYLIWAYHNMYDVNMTANYTFKMHTAKGAVEYMFIEPGFTKVVISDNYMMYWKYNASEDMFYFKVKAKATGWVAFGVSTQEKGMNGYDVMIGGVDNNGAEYIGDYLTAGLKTPPRDVSQDFNMMSWEERDGYTVLSFKRKRDTGDKEDVEIKPMAMYIQWAYHDTADLTENEFKKHSHKGSMAYTFSFTAPEKPTSGSPAMHVSSIFGVLTILFLKYVIGA